MRIRTVKPEFWPHPVMARQSDSVRLAAIALLNIADDEGIFVAEPAIIRSAIWPFDEDSTRTRGALDALSAIGWIELRRHPSHGLMGCVVNFGKHQRIDRPSPSKLATYFLDERSSKIRRVLDDGSSPDQGSGIRDQGAREKEQKAPSAPVVEDGPPNEWEVAPGVIIPSGFQTQECKEAIEFWLAYKKEKRQGYKPQGMKALMSTIQADFTPETLIQAVRKSAAAGWQGLFPPNAPPNGHANGHRYPPARHSEDKQIQEEIEIPFITV